MPMTPVSCVITVILLHVPEAESKNKHAGVTADYQQLLYQKFQVLSGLLMYGPTRGLGDSLLYVHTCTRTQSRTHIYAHTQTKFNG